MNAPTGWFYWAFLSASFAALTAIFAKIGIQGVDSDMATLVRTAIIIVVLAAFVGLAGRSTSSAWCSSRYLRSLSWVNGPTLASGWGLRWLPSACWCWRSIDSRLAQGPEGRRGRRNDRPIGGAFCATLPGARYTTMFPAGPLRYSGTAIALHWLLAVALTASFGVGVFMHGLALSPLKLKLYNWHKWAGITILALSLLRLAWRLTHAPPPDLPMPRWQQRAAHLTHGLLYGLFFAVPLAGWAYSSAAGFPVVLFGVVPLPDFVPADKALAEALEPWHAALAFTLAGLVLLHVAAALKHHFIDRDGLLARMWPRRG